jgi:DNA uptake protein ComE-like DNA-binding protein
MQPRAAALLLLLTAVGGRALLSWRGSSPNGEGRVLTGARAGAPAGQRARAAAHSAEVGAGEVVDVDQASAAELARLPGVGPGLAQRIVAERRRGGSFGGAPCLDARVPGIGEAFLRKAGPHLGFSGGPCVEGGGGCPEIVDLNRAGRGELECLPGIGPARAESILAARSRRGGFRNVDELRSVSGVPGGVVEGLRKGVTVGQVP